MYVFDLQILPDDIFPSLVCTSTRFHVYIFFRILLSLLEETRIKHHVLVISSTSHQLLNLREMCFLPSTLSRNIEGVIANVLVLLPKGIAFYIRFILVLVKRKIPGRDFKTSLIP